MLSCCKRLWLTGLLTLGLSALPASAQEYYISTPEPPLAGHGVPAEGVAPAPAIPVQPSYSAPAPQPNGGFAGEPAAQARHFGRWPLLNRLGSGCWTHHDHYGCSSFRSEARFAFGSCRAFFGESCGGSRPFIPRPVPEDPGFVPGH